MRRRRRAGPRAAALAVALALLGAAPAAGSAQVLAGRVLDARDGSPVHGAEVFLARTDGSPAAAAIADSTGAFLLRVDDAGTYVLRTRRYGYATRMDTVSTTPNGRAWDRAPELGARGRLVVRLSPEAIEADEIVVRAERGLEWGTTQFERRRAEGKGYFLDEDHIRAMEPVYVQEALWDIPDLKVRYGRAMTPSLMATNNAERCVTQLVNGMPGRVDVIDPDDVMGVEVYTNYRDIPEDLAELRDRMSRCALVNYWTRAAWSPDVEAGPGLNFSPVFVWGLVFGMLLLMAF